MRVESAESVSIRTESPLGRSYEVHGRACLGRALRPSGHVDEVIVLAGAGQVGAVALAFSFAWVLSALLFAWVPLASLQAVVELASL